LENWEREQRLPSQRLKLTRRYQGGDPEPASARGAAIAAADPDPHETVSIVPRSLLDYFDPVSYITNQQFTSLDKRRRWRPLFVNTLNTATNDGVKWRRRGHFPTFIVGGIICACPGFIVDRHERTVSAVAAMCWSRLVREARPDWEFYSGCLDSSDDQVRWLQTKHAEEVDPEAARRVGIE